MNGIGLSQSATLDPTPLDILSGPHYSFFTMAGFDAIVQMRSDVLQRFLRQNLPEGPTALASTVPYHPSVVAPEIDELIANRIEASFGGGFDSFRPVSVEARLGNPTVSTLASEVPGNSEASGHDPIATVIWAASFRLVVERVPPRGESIDLDEHSWRNSELFPIPTGTRPSPDPTPEQGFLNLGSGTVQTFARIRAAAQAGFVVWAELQFIPTPLATRSLDVIYTAMLNEPAYRGAIEEALARLYAIEVLRTTPRFSFPMPDMPLVPIGTAPTTEPVAVQLAVTRTPRNNHEVLALCMNAPAQSGQGDVDSVVPFLTTQNYSCSLSFEIARRVVSEGWRNLSLPDGFTADIPIEVSDPDEPANESFRGRARIRSTMQPTDPQVSLSVSPFPLQDALRLFCELEIQLLELWDENGDRVENLGDLGAPGRTPFSWRIQLFDKDPGDDSPATLFLNRIARQLLSRLYTPTVEAIQLSRIEGVTLSARGLVFFRGDLS